MKYRVWHVWTDNEAVVVTEPLDWEDARYEAQQKCPTGYFVVLPVNRRISPWDMGIEADPYYEGGEHA